MTVTDVRARLLNHFANNSSDQPSRWAQLWENEDFLPWDIGFPNPALVDVLSQKQDLIGTCFRSDGSNEKQRKKALVPGCGRGYDVLLLASFGYDAYGLEVSEKVVQGCIQEQKTNGRKYPVEDDSVGIGRASFIQGDFFSDDWIKEIPGGPYFDLIYDYTFLCALPLSRRPAWALRQSQLLASAPHGNLLCLEFPTYKDPSTGGPPFGVTPETYMEHLSHPGEVLPYNDQGHVEKRPRGQLSSMALERVAHWQPERTHEIGKGTDWISVWRHQQKWISIPEKLHV